MSRFDTIDLSKLTSPDVIQTLDYATILKELRDDLVLRVPEIVGIIDLESEPARKLLEVFAAREVALEARVNDAARAVLLALSTGNDLDHLGALYDTARLPGETDARYRERIQLAPEAFSTCGPEGAYVYHSMKVSNSIRDVSAMMTTPGTVRIAVMMEGADPKPDDNTIFNIYKALNDDEVRPLTDVVKVQPVSVKGTDVRVRLTLFDGPDAALVRTKAEASLTAKLESIRYLGYDLKRSAINAACFIDGVQNVEVISPASDIEVDEYECFHINSQTVEYVGRDT